MSNDNTNTTDVKKIASKSVIRVMVVDDSAVIRGLFAKMLDDDPEIKVVTTAANGAIAINYLKRNGPVDLITLDIQMPVMDGLTALPELIKLAPNAKIIMSSTLTKEGAAETLKALSLGATDYLTKPEGRDDRDTFVTELRAKVKALGGKSILRPDDEVRNYTQSEKASKEQGSSPAKAASGEIPLRKVTQVQKPDVLAIGCSTGGPQALTKLLAELKIKKLEIPIFITQHMPPQFTKLFAKQIQDLTRLECAEGIDGEEVVPGRIYLAPGDYHMVIKKKGDKIKISLNQNEPENFCRPAVDPMLRSIVDVYGSKILTVILTGMGSDGLAGSKIVADNGGTIIAQDRESSVIWGMPGAVAMAGLCTKVLPISGLAQSIRDMTQGRIQ